MMKPLPHDILSRLPSGFMKFRELHRGLVLRVEERHR